ncbi:unnamed protein product, partial [Meganyctiphanes norvegica]
QIPGFFKEEIMDKEIEQKETKDVEKSSKEEDEETRGTWDNQCEFFLSCLGYAVGFGNVWRFPYLCYKNGGAAFLIPYAVMLVCAGLPIFFLELYLGQYVSLGANVLFPELAPIFAGLGWAMILASFLVTVYFNLILAWTLFYTVASFTLELPWGHCDNDFNSEGCYTEDAALACANKSLIYYNKSCLNTQDYCAVSGLEAHNQTYCKTYQGDQNDVISVDRTVQRITATEDYFRNRMLGMTGRTWEDMGVMRWELVGYLGLAWLIIALCMIKGVKSSGKVVYFTATFPYVVLTILFVRGMTLEGSYQGIEFYILKPNMTKLWEVEVWTDAASQIFYSLGSSFGALIVLASYNKFKNNCMRDAIVIALSNCATSIFAGFVIFSILGFLAHELGVEVGDVASSGSGLAFIVYPAAVTRMPIPTLWSLLFFTMLITLGLDSQFTYIETLTSAILDQAKWMRPHKTLVVGLICLLCFICGLTMCLEGGIYMFELFQQFSGSLNLVIIALMEVIAGVYIYGFRNIISGLKEMGISIPCILYGYWALTWCILTPLSLGVILVMSLKSLSYASFGDYIYPDWVQGLAYTLMLVVISPIPIMAVYKICTQKSSEMKQLFVTSPNFCPEHVRKQREISASKHSLSTITMAYDNVAFTGTSDKDEVLDERYSKSPVRVDGVHQDVQHRVQDGFQHGIQHGAQYTTQHGVKHGIEQGLQHDLQHGAKYGAEHGSKRSIEQVLQPGTEPVVQQSVHPEPVAQQSVHPDVKYDPRHGTQSNIQYESQPSFLHGYSQQGFQHGIQHGIQPGSLRCSLQKNNKKERHPEWPSHQEIKSRYTIHK